jgi:hypothetical protein
MIKGVVAQPLTAEIFMDCGNIMLAALNFSYFNFITQIVHQNAHCNPLKGVNYT